MAALLGALSPVIALVLGVLVELFRRRARPTAQDGDADAAVRDRLRARVRRHWGGRGVGVLLVCLLVLVLSGGCGGVRTIYVPDGTPVRLREPVRGAKVWVLDSAGQPVPGRMDLPEGWYCLPAQSTEGQIP